MTFVIIVAHKALAAPKGFEPLLTGSEPVVLPLYERAIYLVRQPGLEPGTPGLWSRRLDLNQHLYLLAVASCHSSTSTKSSALPAELLAHSSILSFLAWLAGCF